VLPQSRGSGPFDMDTSFRIGIVEDNDDLRESLVEVLGALGHEVTGFSCAEDLDESPAARIFDLILLDLNLPGEDGLSLAGRLKSAQPGLRVIMMTTRTTLGDRVRGYDVGADLYLPKPVAEDELLAAVRALGRQIQSDARRAADVAEGLLRLDDQALIVRGPHCTVELNAIDVALLAALSRAPGQRLAYWQLLQAIGQQVDEAAQANLAVRITRLRIKLAQTGCAANALKSLRGFGYQLCVRLEVG